MQATQVSFDSKFNCMDDYIDSRLFNKKESISSEKKINRKKISTSLSIDQNQNSNKIDYLAFCKSSCSVESNESMSKYEQKKLESYYQNMPSILPRAIKKQDNVVAELQAKPSLYLNYKQSGFKINVNKNINCDCDCELRDI